MWLTLIMMLISYFASKKSGASSTKAALTASAVGLGTYYVATETKWGQSVEQALDDGWEALVGEDGTAVKNQDGSTAYAPKGSVPKLDASGAPMYDSLGRAVVTLASDTVATTGKVLESWGPTGTAAVIGTTAAATGDSDSKWLWLAGGLAALFILSK